ERRHQLCEALETQLLVEGEIQVNEQQLEAWKQGGQPQAPFSQHLKQRFRWLTESEAHSQEAVDQLLAEGEHELRLLCIRKEIIAGAQTPESDQILRMEYQMQHLKKALEQHLEAPSQQELKTLEKLWYCIPFNQCHSELRGRFLTASDD
ncbi:MAG: hypothetical protein OQK12_08150, partial [Motiliproteus sp.]|nr:hypothetical protein [Motiliproteus sp.]